MALEPRPIAFVLASTRHGTMIVNRFDYASYDDQRFGVGHRLLTYGFYEPGEAAMVSRLLNARRKHFGDGVVVLDIGANIGVFTLEWSKHMAGWGQVVAFEAQEKIFHALCGNVAINNCFNARTVFAAVTNEPGTMRIPVPDYCSPASFGSLELRPTAQPEDIGQPIHYDDQHTMKVATVSIDAMIFGRLDLLKIDVEGMELEVLDGARQSIERHHPIMVIERIKTDETSLRRILAGADYRTFNSGMNIVAIHSGDPTLEIVRQGPALPE